MTSPGVSWQVSACLHQVSWLLHARVVEAKLRDLQLAVKAGFDPNQPRVPRGNPDGGRGQAPVVAAAAVNGQALEAASQVAD